MKLLVIQFPPASVTSPLFSPNIVLSALLSNSFSPRVSLDVRDQVLHQYHAIGERYSFIQFNIYAIKSFELNGSKHRSDLIGS
jgi:hypothetical protein